MPMLHARRYKTDTKSKGKDAAAVSRVSSKGYVHYDRIAKAASVKGMFQNYNPMLVERYSVVQAIKYRVENDLGKKYTDLPQTCLKKKEMSDILALSIQNGKSLLKDDFDEKELRKSFKSYKSQKNFCAVDVEAVISDDDWAHFLRNGLKLK